MWEGIGLALAALTAAGILHYAIARGSRRLPRRLARRRGLPVGRELPHRRAIAFGALALESALWLAALAYAAAQVPALARARDAGLAMLAMAARTPLFSLDDRPFTAIDLVTLPLLLLAVWIGVGVLMRTAQMWMAAVTGAERGLLDTLSVLARYALAALGFLLVLQGWGVDVRSLAILASVLGVGIGFGLQNIANNFVSGLLLNLGRPIQPGDFVEVGEFSGTVVQIGARSTEILTTDEVTILVPNSRFLEHEVVNWSHSDPRCRIRVPVGVAYGSDIRAVRGALLAVADGHPSVLRDPRPSVHLHGFGASALEFELLVWTADPRRKDDLTSDLNFRIEASLRRHRIEIPFPQQDLHLRSPSLERVLEAWRQPAAFAPQPPQASAEEIAPARFGHDHDHGPEAWDESELCAVAERLCGAGGVEIRDRRHLLAVYPRCFIGREAVDWLVEHEGLSRAESVALGQRLLELGAIQHVLDEHDFRDGHFFYCFDRPAPRNLGLRAIS